VPDKPYVFCGLRAVIDKMNGDYALTIRSLGIFNVWGNIENIARHERKLLFSCFKAAIPGQPYAYYVIIARVRSGIDVVIPIYFENAYNIRAYVIAKAEHVLLLECVLLH
jgi:hypothetical protein